MNTIPDEFSLLFRALQQRIPVMEVFKIVDHLLIPSSSTPDCFQSSFVSSIPSNPFPCDPILVKKLYNYLLKKFDIYYASSKYSLNDAFIEFFLSNDFMCEAEEGVCQRFYPLPSPPDQDSRYIHIKSSEALVSTGTTGFSIWEASIALLAVLSSSERGQPIRDLFRDRKVLELGSGTGLGGISIATLTNPSNVLLTDVEQVHDAFTHPNLVLNESLTSKTTSRVVYWTDIEPELLRDFDVLVGCDLVYDPDLNEILFPAIQVLLSPESSIHTALLICTIRNPSTFDSFLEKLSSLKTLNVKVSLLDQFIDTNCPVILQSVSSLRLIHIDK